MILTCLVPVLLMLAQAPADNQSPAKTSFPGRLSEAQRQEARDLLARLESGPFAPEMEAVGWTLCHCASEEGAARVQGAVEAISAYAGGNEQPLAELGGPEGFRKALRRLLRDPDPVVRGFVAETLGALGDQESKGEIARLVKTKPAEPPKEEDYDAEFDRGRSAMALGMLGATEYADELAQLLRDPNPQTRGGAALGLGYLRGQQYADRVAPLLSDDNDNVQITAIYSLAMMDARSHAKEIAGLLGAGGDPAIAETACYALVRLNAKEHAPDIRRLLDEPFQQGYAAKALALMGADQYAKDIAAVLASENSLSRRDALVALGILKATAYEKDVAERLGDKESFVQSAAALALLLMDARAYSSEITARLTEVPEHDFNYHEFNPLVRDQLKELRARAEQNWKAITKTSGAEADGRPEP